MIFFEKIYPFLVPLCFIFAWSFLIFLGWTLLSTIRETLAKAKQMHSIPCTNCRFFNNNYRLKCTVQPHIANTEQAIHCLDYVSD